MEAGSTFLPLTPSPLSTTGSFPIPKPLHMLFPSGNASTPSPLFFEEQILTLLLGLSLNVISFRKPSLPTWLPVADRPGRRQ